MRYYDLHIRLRPDELAAIDELDGDGLLAARARGALLSLVGWPAERVAESARLRVEAHRAAMARARARRRPGTVVDHDKNVIPQVPETNEYS